MASVKLTTAKGKAGKAVDLDDAWFGVEPNLPVMHQVVTAQLAARRAGTQSTKTRAEACQVWPAANSTQACGGICSASMQAACKSSFRAPTGEAPITSRGPVTGNAATGRPLASASSRTRPNVSVLLGNTKTSAAA